MAEFFLTFAPNSFLSVKIIEVVNALERFAPLPLAGRL